MALLFCDGFDYYTTIANVYESANGSTIGTNAVRTGTNGIRMASGQNNVRKTLSTGYATLVAGVAYRSSGAFDPWVLSFLDAGSYQFALLHDGGTGLLSVYRGQPSPGSGVVLATSTRFLNPSVWYFIEAKVTINNSTGSIEVRVNGETWITVSSVDTQATANATVNMVSLGRTGSNTSGTADYDDFYVCDISGSVNNDFLGDIGVATLFANGAGASAQFTATGAANNQSCVDETTPNDDTDYNVSSTVGHIDSLAMSNLPGTATSVKGIQVTRRSRKDDVGARSLRTRIKSSATTSNGTTTSESSSYVNYRDIFEQDPNAGPGAWTPTTVNAMEAGYEVIS